MSKSAVYGIVTVRTTLVDVEHPVEFYRLGPMINYINMHFNILNLNYIHSTMSVSS